MRGLEAVDVLIRIVVRALRDEVFSSHTMSSEIQASVPCSGAYLVCGVHLVMPNGGETDGTMPPLPFGVTPYVPILGLTYCSTPAL